MPAIDIGRLKVQAAVLVEKFDQPAVFIKELHAILDNYADRSAQKGLNAAPVTVIPAYRVPQPVLKQIEMELNPLAITFPDQTLNLAEKLWEDGTLECRLIGAYLVGKIAPDQINIAQFVKKWVSETRDYALRAELLKTSLNRMRKEKPALFLRMMRDWLDPNNNKMWANAIHAIIPLLQDAGYDNLPPLFNMLSPVIKNLPSIMQNDLVELINCLYATSPIETIFFLRQMVTGSATPQFPMMLRRVIPQLDAALRPVVLEIVRNKAAQS